MHDMTSLTTNYNVNGFLSSLYRAFFSLNELGISAWQIMLYLMTYTMGFGDLGFGALGFGEMVGNL